MILLKYLFKHLIQYTNKLNITFQFSPLLSSIMSQLILIYKKNKTSDCAEFNYCHVYRNNKYDIKFP